MSLRFQVASGFAVVAIPVVIVALVAVAAIDRLGGAVGGVLQDNERTLEAAAEMDGALERFDSAALLALLGRDAEASAIAEEAGGRFRSALAVAAGNLTVPGEGDVVRAVDAAFGDLDRAYGEVARGEPEAARAAYADAFVPAFRRTRDRLSDLRTLNREAAQEAARDTQATASTTTWAVVVGALIALALVAWAAARVSRQIAASYDRRPSSNP